MNERDETTIAREDMKAQPAEKIGEWVRFGYVVGSRSMTPRPIGSGRRCDCGCRTEATHFGLSDGLVMMSGCELRARRWVRDGYMIARARRAK
jgi:hypothetical protein